MACGDSSGRILVYSGLEQPEPARSILHWHQLPVAGLAWSEGGTSLYSGGGEAVLCKWRREEGGKPQFVPRLGAPIVGVGGGGGVSVVQLKNNSLVLLDRQEEKVRGVVGGLARSETGYPAGLVVDGDRLLLNGLVGRVQVWSSRSGGVHHVDITGQNYLAAERSSTPHNSEVERVAVSSCCQWLATIDCQWSLPARVTLRLWAWDSTSDNWVLNTQVGVAGGKHLHTHPHKAVWGLHMQFLTEMGPPTCVNALFATKSIIWRNATLFLLCILLHQ